MRYIERYRCPVCLHEYTVFEFFERLESVDDTMTECKNCGEVTIDENWRSWVDEDGDEI